MALTFRSSVRILRMLAAALACALPVLQSGLIAAATEAASRAQPVDDAITSWGQIWTIPEAERGEPHPLRLELVVHYYDPHWKLLWAWDGTGDAFIPLESVSPVVKSGQRILVEGSVVPARGLPLGDARIKILEERAAIEPLDTRGQIGNFRRFDPRPVTAEGYVNRQREIDPNHLLLELAIEGQPVSARVLVDGNQPLPQVEGAIVRLTGLYVASANAASPVAKVDLWIPSTAQVQILGWLENDGRFDAASVPIELLPASGKEPVRVVGTVRSQVPGASLVIRDETGQVSLKTAMTRLVESGVRVEAVGYPGVDGGDRVLEQCLYRPARQTPVNPALIRGLPLLRMIDQVRALPIQEATGHPVRLSALVTWSNEQARFFFIRDASGGTRVELADAAAAIPPPGSRLVLEGTAAAGDFAPVVIARELRAAEFVPLPEARPVTLEHALTGVEEGQWVKLSGYVRGISTEGPWTRLELTTFAGEFAALLPPNEPVAALIGSVVSIQGVCSAVTNAQRQLTGIRLWVAQREDIRVDESAPAEPFKVAARPMASLRQFNTLEGVNHRVRVGGVVVHQQPGMFLDLQEGAQSLRVLSRSGEQLRPGERVEAVGFVGRQANRVVLREAVWRRLDFAGEPAPVELGELDELKTELDGRLVRVNALLMDAGVRPMGQRLFCESGSVVFEALLGGTAAEAADWRRGSRLELTGVYEVQPDAYGRPQAMQLLLRSPADVKVLRRAPWWTVERALVATVVLAIAIMLGLGWVNALRNRVARQTALIREQLEKAARLEAELLQSSKLESLGVLAGGIAHDFNNLLTVVMGNLSLVLTEDSVDAEAKHFLRESERAAMRARDLTQQLLTFSKGGVPVRAAVLLPDIVREAAGFAQHGSTVRCDFTVASDLWPADADRGQVAQVVHNIVINATQAMPGGGVVHIALQNDHVTQTRPGALDAGRYVKMTISDTGEGISPEHLARIFDPYFTTKQRGSGLGLATVYSIIKKHLGHIEVSSSRGQGTTFRIWLPAATQVPEQVAPAAGLIPRWTGRVLVMDDEAPIRDFMSALLHRMGFEVTAVGNGDAAVKEYAAARENGSPFSFVILDLTIPAGMGGAAAMEKLRVIDPHVRAIVSSGYSADPVIARYRSFGFCGLVPKPYSVDEVVRVIGDVMQTAGCH